MLGKRKRVFVCGEVGEGTFVYEFALIVSNGINGSGLGRNQNLFKNQLTSRQGDF